MKHVPAFVLGLLLGGALPALAVAYTSSFTVRTVAPVGNAQVVSVAASIKTAQCPGLDSQTGWSAGTCAARPLDGAVTTIEWGPLSVIVSTTWPVPGTFTPSP